MAQLWIQELSVLQLKKVFWQPWRDLQNTFSSASFRIAVTYDPPDIPGDWSPRCHCTIGMLKATSSLTSQSCPNQSFRFSHAESSQYNIKFPLIQGTCAYYLNKILFFPPVSPSSSVNLMVPAPQNVTNPSPGEEITLFCLCIGKTCYTAGIQ